MAKELKADDNPGSPGEDSDDLIFIPPIPPPLVVVEDSDSNSQHSSKSISTNDLQRMSIKEQNESTNENDIKVEGDGEGEDEGEDEENKEIQLELELGSDLDGELESELELELEWASEGDSDAGNYLSVETKPKTVLIQLGDNANNALNIKEMLPNIENETQNGNEEEQNIQSEIKNQDANAKNFSSFHKNDNPFHVSESEKNDTTSNILDDDTIVTDLENILLKSSGIADSSPVITDSFLENSSNQKSGKRENNISLEAKRKLQANSCYKCRIQRLNICFCDKFITPCWRCGTAENLTRCMKCEIPIENNCRCASQYKALCRSCSENPNKGVYTNHGIENETKQIIPTDNASEVYYMQPASNWFQSNLDGCRLPRLSSTFPKKYQKANNTPILQSNMSTESNQNTILTNVNLNAITKNSLDVGTQLKISTISSSSDDLEIVDEVPAVAKCDVIDSCSKDITYVLSSDHEEEDVPTGVPSNTQPSHNNVSQEEAILIDSESDVSLEASCSQLNRKRSNSNFLLKRSIIIPQPRYSSTSSDSDSEENIQKHRRKRINPLSIVILSDYDGDEDTPSSKSPKSPKSIEPLPLKKRKTNLPRRLSVDREDGIQMGIDVDNVASGQYPTHVANIKRGPAIERYNNY